MRQITVAVLATLAAALAWGVLGPVQGASPAGGAPGEDALTAAFEASGAAFSSYYLNGWTPIDRKLYDLNQLESIARRAAASLQLDPGRLEVNHFGDQRFRQVILNHWDGSVSRTIIAQSFRAGAGEEAYLVVEASGGRSVDGMRAGREELERVLLETGSPPEITACVIGILNGKLDVEQRKTLVQRVFSRVQALEVEGIEGGDLSSFSAYTPLATDEIQVGGRRINLNVALRAVPRSGRTIITIGSPVIPIEY